MKKFINTISPDKITAEYLGEPKEQTIKREQPKDLKELFNIIKLCYEKF